MNWCIISGIVINKIELKFVFNNRRKMLAKEHISLVKILLELENKQIVNLHAYNEMADYFYRNVKQYQKIYIQGKIRNYYIEVIDCE